MKGTRLKEWDGDTLLKDGEYGKHPRNNVWYCKTPNGHMGNLGAHDITEHDDGTITVSPSILITLPGNVKAGNRELWHGFLEKGVWRSC